jgi:hypothetical protein
MGLPILELLNAKKEWLENDPGEDWWREAIEEYAPGYLEMEQNGSGMAADYDAARLMLDPP